MKTLILLWVTLPSLGDTKGPKNGDSADPNTLYSIVIDGDRLTPGDVIIKVKKSKNPLDSIEVVLPADSNKMNEIKN